MSSSASYTTTKQEGWNNGAVAADQTNNGAIIFSSNYYGEDRTMTEAASSANDVIIHSADGEGESVSMFGMKNGAGGMLTMPGGERRRVCIGQPYGKFDPDADLTAMPVSAYQGFITMDDGGSFALTFSGLKPGTYDVLLAAGRTYASGGTAAAASYAS